MTSLYREASCHCETHVFYGAWQSKRLCWIASPRKKHEVRNDEKSVMIYFFIRDKKLFMPYSQIIGTGTYLPERILTNYDLEKMMETSHEWILDRTGISARHIAAAHET